MTFFYVRIGLRGACGCNMRRFQGSASDCRVFYRALDFAAGMLQIGPGATRLANC
jgi:hypothetical protein